MALHDILSVVYLCLVFLCRMLLSSFTFVATDIFEGASSGIGRGVAIHLASLGAKLVITGRDAQQLQV